MHYFPRPSQYQPIIPEPTYWSRPQAEVNMVREIWWPILMRPREIICLSQTSGGHTSTANLEKRFIWEGFNLVGQTAKIVLFIFVQVVYRRKKVRERRDWKMKEQWVAETVLKKSQVGSNFWHRSAKPLNKSLVLTTARHFVFLKEEKKKGIVYKQVTAQTVHLCVSISTSSAGFCGPVLILALIMWYGVVQRSVQVNRDGPDELVLLIRSYGPLRNRFMTVWEIYSSSSTFRSLLSLCLSLFTWTK